MSTVVHLDRISKAYESKVAVKELSLQIDSGVMFGLLGPNGAGKTSSIRMMIGITMPDSGVVNLFGKPFTRDSLKRVGYLPEERGLYKKMKVMDQLVFMGQLRGLDPDHSWLRKLPVRGIIVTARSDSPEFDFVSRFFAPGSGIDEDPDGHWHLFLVVQVVEDHRHVVRLVGQRVGVTVLKHHDARRLGFVVLRRDVNPVLARGALEDFALPLERPFELPLRNVLLRQRVGTEFIVVGRESREGDRKGTAFAAYQDP